MAKADKWRATLHALQGADPAADPGAAKILAVSWETCAVGECFALDKAAHHGREITVDERVAYIDGQKNGRKILNLGHSFTAAVLTENYAAAEKILDAIERLTND